MANYGTLGLAAVFSAVGLLLTAISFSTDHWVTTTVDRQDMEEALVEGGLSLTQFSQDQAYYSRNRGLFRTCYEIGDTQGSVFLDLVREEDIVDGNCVVERGYEIDGEDKRFENNDDYDVRIHLMRTHFAFYVVGMFLVVVAVIGGAVGCWRYSTTALKIAAFCCIAAFLFIAGGIAFFHGYEYLEKEKINLPQFPKFYLQTEILDKYTTMDYGYSYILGWLGAACTLMGGILYMCVAWSVQSDKQRGKEPFEDSKDSKHPHHNQYDYPVAMGHPQMMGGSVIGTPTPSMYGGQGQGAYPMAYAPAGQVAYAPAPSLYQGYGH